MKTNYINLFQRIDGNLAMGNALEYHEDNPQCNKPKIHHIKCYVTYFDDIVDGKKTFVLRFNDRDYRVNDTLILQEYNSIYNKYTGRSLEARVVYLLESTKFGLKEGYAILGIKISGRVSLNTY